METKSILKDRFKAFLDFYNLSPDLLSKKIGGSRGTYFNIQNGSSSPDYKTLENILNNFPDISAEWLFRGQGSMLKDDLLTREESEAIRAESRAIKSLYKAELQGKDSGVSSHPQVDREGASDLLDKLRRGNIRTNNRALLNYTWKFTNPN